MSSAVRAPFFAEGKRGETSGYFISVRYSGLSAREIERMYGLMHPPHLINPEVGSIKKQNKYNNNKYFVNKITIERFYFNKWKKNRNIFYFLIKNPGNRYEREYRKRGGKPVNLKIEAKLNRFSTYRRIYGIR